MESRLQKLFLWTALLMSSLLGTSSQSIAQENNPILSSSTLASNITLIYTGPDTIYVGDNCSAPLDWGAPNSVSFVCNDPALATVSATDNCPAPGSTSDEVTITYDGETTVSLIKEPLSQR